MAQAPSTFKLLTSDAAKDLAKQIVNRYLVLHGMPVAGVGQIEEQSPERVKNKAAQTVYKAKHARYSVWASSDNSNIVNAYEKKLNALRLAKRNYLSAFASYNKAKTRYDKAVIAQSPRTGYFKRIMDEKFTIKENLHNIYIAAQSLNYTGDGTAL